MSSDPAARTKVVAALSRTTSSRRTGGPPGMVNVMRHVTAKLTVGVPSAR